MGRADDFEIGITHRTVPCIPYVGGNPTNWYNGSGTEYTDLYWEQGCRLSSVQYQDAEAQYEASYEYDMSGVRTKKNVDGEVHTYVTQNGRVVQESYGSIVLKFFYDAGGKPFALRYSNDAGVTWTTMYYVLNAQGDVVKLVGAFTGSGYNTYASYEYDAWGRVLRATSTYTNVPKYAHIAEINPLRYRGYYYDTETGWYYLQSRYYDPIIKRFLNADTYASTGQGFLGYNMFAYCGNCPVIKADYHGDDAIIVVDIDSAKSYGHVFLLVQDEHDNWHYFSFYSRRNSTATVLGSLFLDGVSGQLDHSLLGDATGYDLTNLGQLRDFLASANASKTAEDLDYATYYKGDFIDTYKSCSIRYYIQENLNFNIKYNLFKHNCMHFALEHLMQGKGLSESQKAMLWLCRLKAAPKNVLDKILASGEEIK